MMSKLLQWIRNNKLLIFLLLSTVSLFIATVIVSTRTSRHASACPQQSRSSYFKKNLKYSEDDNFKNKSAYYRLPRHTIPKSYNLLLKPDMTEKNFKGIVRISLQVTKSTMSITLHSNKLNITSTSLRKEHNGEIKIVSAVTVPGKREFLIINAENGIPKGTYELIIHFTGRLDRGFIGFYSSTLKNGG